MVKDNRIQTYIFRVGSLTASAAGLIDVYTDTAINGHLDAIQVGANTFAATGSFQLFESGGQTQLWKIVSGTSTSNVRVADSYMPRAICRWGVDNNLASGTSFTQFDRAPLNSILRFVGSGLGNGTSGLSITIAYD